MVQSAYIIEILLDENSGSWNKALEAADLLPTGFHRNIDKTELFANIEHLWIAKGRQPTVSDLQGNLSEYGPKAYFRVFGSWANALRTFAEYINHNDLADRGPSCFPKKLIQRTLLILQLPRTEWLWETTR